MADFKAMRSTIEKIDKTVKGDVDEMRLSQEKIDSFVNNDLHAFSGKINKPTQDTIGKEIDPGNAANIPEANKISDDLYDAYEERRLSMRTPSETYYDMYKPYQEVRQKEVDQRIQDTGLIGKIGAGYNRAIAKDTPANLDQTLFEYDQKIKEGDEEFFYNLKEGLYQSELTQILANEAYRKMMQMPNEYDKVNDFIDSHPQLYPNSDAKGLKWATRSAANFVGFMKGGLREGIDDALVAGVGAAGVAALATAPLAPVSVPSALFAGAGAGMSKGVYENMVVTEGGLNYVEMLDAGIDPDIARNVSLTVGAINGMIESAQLATLTYGPGIQAATGAAKGLSKATIVKSLIDVASGVGITSAEEAIEEMTQEMTSIESVKLGKMLQNLRDKEGGEPLKYSAQDFAGSPEVADQVIDVGIATFFGSMVLGGVRSGTGGVAGKTIDLANNKKLSAQRQELLYEGVPAVLTDYENGAIRVDTQERADRISVLKQTLETSIESPVVKAKDKEQAQLLIDRINLIENNAMVEAKNNDSRVSYAPANTTAIEDMFLAEDFDLKSVELGNKITENTIAAYKQAKSMGIVDRIGEAWADGDSVAEITRSLISDGVFKKKDTINANMTVNSTLKMQREFKYQSGINALNNLKKAAKINEDSVLVEEMAADNRDVEVKTPFPSIQETDVSLAKIFVDPKNFKYSDAGSVNTAIGMMLWEDENGDLYLAGGYPSYVNAKQAGANKVGTTILKNDEYTHQEADTLTSLVNIMEGNGGAIEIAEMIRNNDLSIENANEVKAIAVEAEAQGTITTEAKDNLVSAVDEGIELSKLDDEAFQDVLTKKETPVDALAKAEEVEAIEKGVEEVVERKKPEKGIRTVETEVQKEKQIKPREQVTIEGVLAQESLKVLYEKRAKKHPTYKVLKPIVDAAKTNPFLRGISLKFIDRVKEIKLTEKELKKVGYENYDQGKFQIQAEFTTATENGETGTIVLYRGASKDALLEEIVHALQTRLNAIDPELKQMIKAWEDETHLIAQREGYSIPSGIELFAHGFVFTESGYADKNPEIARLISIPDEIATRFKALLLAKGDGKKAVLEVARGMAFPELDKSLRAINPNIDFEKVLTETSETVDKQVAVAQTDMMNLLQRNGAFVAVNPKGEFAIMNQVEEVEDEKRMVRYKLEYFDESTNSVKVDEFVSSKDAIESLTDGDYYYLFRKPKKTTALKGAPSMKPIMDLNGDKTNNRVKLATDKTATENIRYHAGDLGIAETYWRMRGNRGTGHFGTGTYFVKNIENLGSFANERPVSSIDVSKLNLLSMDTRTEYENLHSGLKFLNRISTEYNGYASILRAIQLNKFDAYRDNDLSYAARELAKVSVQLTGESLSADQMLEKLMPTLMYGAQLTRGNWFDRVDPGHMADSPSTFFMKSLGFDGVDTNGVEGIDNTTYGGVIYRDTSSDVVDLKNLMTPEEVLAEGLIRQTITDDMSGIEFTIVDPVTREESKYSGKFVKDVDNIDGNETFIISTEKSFVLDNDSISESAKNINELSRYFNDMGIGSMYIPAREEYGFSLEGTTESEYMHESPAFYEARDQAAFDYETDAIYVRLINGEFYIMVDNFENFESEYENTYYSLKESEGVPAVIDPKESDDPLMEEYDFEVNESKLKKSILESPRFSKELKDIIKQANFLYTTKTQYESMLQAAEKIQTNGFEEEFVRLSLTDAWTDVEVAEAILLAERADDIGDRNRAVQIAEMTAVKGRTAGRLVSALYMMKKNTPAEWLRLTQKDFSEVTSKSKVNRARKATTDIQDDLSRESKQRTAEKKDSIAKESTKKAKEKLTAEEIFTRKILRQFTKVDPPAGIDVMINSLFRKAMDLGIPARERVKANPMDVLVDAIKNRDRYKEVWTAARDDVFEKFADNPEIMGQIREFFAFDEKDNLIVPRSVLKDAIESAMIDLEVTIGQIIDEYYVDGRGNTSPTVESLISFIKRKTFETVGEISDDEARILADAISNEIDLQISEFQRKSLDALLKKRKFKPKERKTIIDRTLELAKFGAFENEGYYQAIADKLGIPVMTPELAQYISDQAKLIQSLEDGSKQQLIEIARMHDVIGSQIPGHKIHKVRTYRILMMLFNPKTWEKNIVGNTGFGIVDTLAMQTFAIPVDYLASKLTGKRTRGITIGQSVKTQASEFMKVINEFKQDYTELGFADAVSVLRESVSTNKFEFKPRKSFYRGKNPVETILSEAEDILTVALLLPDRAAYAAAHAESVQNQLIVTGLDTATEDMVEKANQDALRRTFQDDTRLAQFFMKAREAMNFGLEFGLGDLVIPFAKTPANLIMRGIDYTPIGLITGTTKAIYDTKKGVNPQIVQANMVEAYARALAGLTMTLGMGFALGAQGLATGAQDDDDKDIYYLKQEAGYLNNAINWTGIKRWINSGFDPEAAKMQFGDKLIDYGWMEPFGLTMSIGVEVGIAFKKGSAQDLDVSALMIAALAAGVKTIEEQPMLQGITSLLEGEGIVETIESTLVNSVSSFTPTLGNYLSIALTNRKSETYDATSQLNTAINQVKKRIPGLSSTLPKRYTKFGEEYNYFDENSTAFGRMMSLLANPAITKTYEPSDEAMFVIELYERSGETAQAPRRISRKQNIKYRDPDTGEMISRQVILNNEEYSELTKYAGDLVKKEFDIMMEAGYDRLPAERQAQKMSNELTEIGRLVREKAAEIKGLK